MANTTTRRVIVTGLTRLNSTASGNPRFLIHTEDAGDFTSQSDASFCYGIENDRVRGENRQEATLTLTRAGRVCDMAWHPLIGNKWPRDCDHDRDICTECVTVCRPCGEQFGDQMALRVHVANAHKLGEYGCEHCGREMGH